MSKAKSNGTPVAAATEEMPEAVVADRRQPKVETDRRKTADRRQKQVPVAFDRRQGDRRTGERRRQVDPTTCERDYTEEEIAFMRAMDEYKRDFARPFPTWSEVLEIFKSLGYRKVAEPTVIVANRAKANLMND
jgi:hypothetical protein